MSEPPKLSEEAARSIQDVTRSVLSDAMRQVADMVRRDPSALAYIPPEEWTARMDRVAIPLVNHALNVAWKDWNNE